MSEVLVIAEFWLLTCGLVSWFCGRAAHELRQPSVLPPSREEILMLFGPEAFDNRPSADQSDGFDQIAHAVRLFESA